jgi:Flp pilus assembly protein TadD
MINRGIAAMQEGDVEEARTWYARAAEAGDTEVMSSLAHIAHDEGDVEGARAWLARAVEAGDTLAMCKAESSP